MFWRGAWKKRAKKNDYRDKKKQVSLLLVYQQVSLASHGYDSIDISIEGDCRKLFSLPCSLLCYL